MLPAINPRIAFIKRKAIDKNIIIYTINFGMSLINKIYKKLKTNVISKHKLIYFA